MAGAWQEQCRCCCFERRRRREAAAGCRRSEGCSHGPGPAQRSERQLLVQDLPVAGARLPFAEAPLRKGEKKRPLDLFPLVGEEGSGGTGVGTGGETVEVGMLERAAIGGKGGKRRLGRGGITG